MHLAVQSAFPNLSASAEREFIARLHIAGRSLGWRVTDVTTSDDILSCAPDMVLATHEFTPKLTQYPTFGVIWSPLDYFSDDPLRIRNILSYDGCLVATQALRKWTQALFDRYGKRAPVSGFDFLPTALSRAGAPAPSEPALFYAGVHWDGARHGDLFSELEGRCPMRIFGKAEKWQGHVDYAGALPFDGTAVVDAIAQCGIALAIHTEAHRLGDTPSMRLFEAAAAGAVIIADRMPFALRHFGDTALWIDADQPASQVASQIARHVDWVRSNPDEAADMAGRANRIFRDEFELTDQLAHLPEFVETAHESRTYALGGADKPAPLVEVILRVGSRPVGRIARALGALADQTYPHIGLVVVKFREVAGLEALLAEHSHRFVHIRVVEVPDNGLRSTALWAGLQAIQGDFLANLDDDDALHPTHIAGLVRGLLAAPAHVPLVYSGTIEVQEEDGHWFDQPNFRGDIEKVIPERRRLRFMDAFSQERMYAFDNFINSNAWMMRRSALDAQILEDPAVRVAEDVYLYLMVMRQGPFQLVPEATALWFWRSSSRDNSMFSEPCWAEDGPLIAKRLRAFGALPPEAPALSPDEAPVETTQSASEEKAVGPRQIFRRPSLLLGPLAPGWRRLRNRLFRKSRRVKEQQDREISALRTHLEGLAMEVAALAQAGRERDSRHAEHVFAFGALEHEMTALQDRMNTLEERGRDAEQARRDAALALRQLALREMDIADLRRRHAALTEENALLAAAMPCDRQIGAPVFGSGTEGMDQPAPAMSADQTQSDVGKA